MRFIRQFRIVQVSERKHINLTRASAFITELAEKTKLPLNAHYLSLGDINKILNHRF